MARSRAVPRSRNRTLGGQSGGAMARRARPLPALSTSTMVLRSQTKSLKQNAHFAQAASQTCNRRKDKISTKRRKRLDPWYPKRKINPHPRPRPPPPTHFTCRICISYLPSSSFVAWTPPRRARFGQGTEAPFSCIPHLARNPYRRNVDPVCKECVGNFMAARLETRGARAVSIGCVEPGCDTKWSWDMVMKYFPPDKLEEYNLEMFSVWKSETGLFTCLSPTCSTSGLLDTSTPGYPQIQCDTCSLRQCASCLTPWHAGQTCAEISAAAIDAQMTDAEKETLELMQSKDGKRCPNCQLVIEKDGGCDSMHCSGCKKHFNWSTAASAVPGKKKAIPVMSGQGYWQTPGIVVCEVDRVADVNTDPTFYNVGLGFGVHPTMPLPDEDDMDL